MSAPDLHRVARSIRQAFIKFDHVNAIHGVLAALVTTDYGQCEPDIVFIVGEPGTGKTWLIKRFVANYPREDHETVTRVPVLLVNVPPKCVLKRLPGAMLQALGSPLWNVGDEEQRSYQLETLLKKCGVRLVILNEANHLVDRGKEKSHYLLGDWIKLMSEKTGIPFVLVGIPRVKVLLGVNEQLADRVREVVTVEPFGIDPRCKNQMSTALAAFDKLLDGVNRIPLSDAANAQRFALATAGRLRRIRRVLEEAARAAGALPKPKIDLPLLAEVFRTHVFSGAPDQRNPFVPGKFDGRPLTGPGEPYEPRRQAKEEVDA
ncbi:MAG: TniB family NTP-binding protein [Burkholderiaceae bacterium]|nr:TniB family NTP-binding protein [Burkholderiaceae bacterium]